MRNSGNLYTSIHISTSGGVHQGQNGNAVAHLPGIPQAKGALLTSLTFAFRACFLLTAALISCVVSGNFLAAQQSAQSSPAGQQPAADDLVIKSHVRRVIVDVVVTDSLGKPVRGLTQKDFSVAEDDRPQEILSFDVHDLETASDYAQLPPLPANTFVNVPTEPEHGPLYVLLLDLVNTETTDEPTARQQLLKFINGKPPGTRFAIFALSDGLHLVQGFTDDQKQLSAVLDPSHPRPHLPRVFLYQNNYGRGDPDMMMSVFGLMSRFLDGLPGRKNLIWFSGEFPLDLFPSDTNSSVSYREQVKTTLSTMARSQVAIYPVDIRGVIIDNPHAPAGSTGTGGLTSDYRSGGSVEPASDSAQTTGSSFSNVAQATAGAGYSLIANSQLTQNEIARVTGGRAFYSDNGLKEVLEEAVEDGANYYSISYKPSNQNYNGALRNIRVELSNKHDHLAYRRSYYADDLDAPPLPHKGQSYPSQDIPERKVGDSLSANMQHGAPMAHQIVFRAHVHTLGSPALATPEQMANLIAQPAYFRVRRKNRPVKPLPPIQVQTYAIDYAMVAQSKQATARSVRPPALEIAAVAYDGDGRMLNGIVEETVPTPPAASGEANKPGLFRAHQQLDVPLTASSIRIAVRDMSSDRIGALEVRLPLAPETPVQTAAPARPPSPDPPTANPN